MKKKAHIINFKDNVAVAVADLKKGDTVKIEDETQNKIIIKAEISYGHKFAIKNLKMGNEIIKYGEVIGRATRNIEIGSHVHVHNIESLRGRGDLNLTIDSKSESRCK
jgi:altronate dehydratase small subunit